MSEPVVRLERKDRIAILTLDNPPVNAMGTRLARALHAALDEAEAMVGLRCAILVGAGGRAFCAGGDLREESAFGTPADARAFHELGRGLLNRIEGFPVPIVAAIHGWCIGGGTAIAWSCDIRIAAETATFRAADAHLGMVPSWGMGLSRLPRLVGRNNALDVLLLGEDFDAARAYALGLVTKIVACDRLMEEAWAAATRIADASPTAIRATRRAIAYNLRHRWDEMVRFEEELCDEVFAHADAHEGPKAFGEKRKPAFKDV